VLKDICRKIAADESRHYKLFFTNMERYRAKERPPVWQRLWVAVTRFKEADDEELSTAYRVANDLPEPDAPEQFVEEYMGCAFGFYQERHARRVGHMVAQAVGFRPGTPVGRFFQKALWWVIERRGRTMRPALLGTAA